MTNRIDAPDVHDMPESFREWLGSMTVKRCLIVTAVLAVAGIATGCGGGSSGGTAQPPPQTTSASTSPSATATVTAPTPTVTKTTGSGGRHGCATDALSVTLGQGQGAAGTFYSPILFTNSGSSACTLFGYPGVSFTDSHHTQIGPSAAREPGPKKVISLAPGQQASALLRRPDVGNYASSACHKQGARFLKVFPPGQTVAAYVALPSGTDVCTTSAGRSGVGTIQAGTDPR